jgi:hypothetical protein
VSLFSSGSAKRKWPKVSSREDIIQKVWDCIRTSNGIMVSVVTKVRRFVGGIFENDLLRA